VIKYKGLTEKYIINLISTAKIVTDRTRIEKVVM